MVNGRSLEHRIYFYFILFLLYVTRLYMPITYYASKLEVLLNIYASVDL